MKLHLSTWPAQHANNWRLRRWRRQAQQIALQTSALKSLTEDELHRQAQNLAWRARSTSSAREFVCEAFALVGEAARRAQGQVYYDEQIMAGLALVSGGIAEMQTGEGKTLASLLPTMLHAMEGFGGHVVTANDYLAQRDSTFARDVFRHLGFTVGCITNDLPREARQREYDCHITYGTAHEFGFDFLRDALAEDAAEEAGIHHSGQAQNCGKNEVPLKVQRGFYFAMVDEADSVLLDDARTPLLIASGEKPSPATVQLYRWARCVAGKLNSGTDYQVDLVTSTVRLTRIGCQRLLQYSQPTPLAEFEMEQLYRQVEQALTATLLVVRDRDYLVRESDVAIIDPATGRIAEGRQWQDGLHQAVEVKEGLEPSAVTSTSARVTLQNFFRRYQHVCGLTGTARGAEREFAKIYELDVARIPPRRPCQRKSLPPRIFRQNSHKLAAVVRSIQERLKSGQAVLVGTPSVRASEQLAELLTTEQIEHQVLNCRQHAAEARIIAQAGQSGRVTVATSMAGRGTDIKVSPEVLAAGGLHVIATEMQASRRIDLQFLGRTGRQGEPGSYQMFLSLEDELFAETSQAATFSTPKGELNSSVEELPATWLRHFQRTQRNLESKHERERYELSRCDREHQRSCRKLGLNPLLETVE